MWNSLGEPNPQSTQWRTTALILSERGRDSNVSASTGGASGVVSPMSLPFTGRCPTPMSSKWTWNHPREDVSWIPWILSRSSAKNLYSRYNMVLHPEAPCGECPSGGYQRGQGAPFACFPLWCSATAQVRLPPVSPRFHRDNGEHAKRTRCSSGSLSDSLRGPPRPSRPGTGLSSCAWSSRPLSPCS